MTIELSKMLKISFITRLHQNVSYIDVQKAVKNANNPINHYHVNISSLRMGYKISRERLKLYNYSWNLSLSIVRNVMLKFQDNRKSGIESDFMMCEKLFPIKKIIKRSDISSLSTAVYWLYEINKIVISNHSYYWLTFTKLLWHWSLNFWTFSHKIFNILRWNRN